MPNHRLYPASAVSGVSSGTMGATQPLRPLRLLTFNTWGLKYIAAHRTTRLAALAAQLASGPEVYDVVALQEVWVEADWAELERVCGARYPYRRVFSAGLVAGPGLCVLSRHPIKELWLYRFPVNGRPGAITRGDWYVGKSAAVCVLSTPHGELAVVNSHMHAPYNHNVSSPDHYLCHRTCQAWDLAKLVRMLQRQCGVVVVGDMNCTPGLLPQRVLLGRTGLVDLWVQHRGEVATEAVAQMLPQEQVEVAGVTCDSTINTWRATRRVDEAVRLDYGLISTQLRAVESEVRFTEPVPHTSPPISYSDHFAYAFGLEFVEPEERGDGEWVAGEWVVTCSEVVEAIDSYMAGEFRLRQRRGYAYMGLAVVLIVATLVLTEVFGRFYIGIPMEVVGLCGLWLGLVNGLMFGVLFPRSEARALAEVRREVQDEMDWGVGK